jgi:hypothetical protein
MKITFRHLSTEPPAAGEIHIRPVEAQTIRRELANLVLEAGLAGLARGSEPWDQVVVDADPTFDDLLAATFVIRLSQGQPLPEGCRAFARYAALARQGLRPGMVPPEFSLEGIYLALRGAAGEDLSQSTAAERMRADWSRMAEAILQAAEQGVDPFTTPLFASGEAFARERAFLAQDLAVYRQDILRGERWLVRLPEGPPQAAALILRRPKSLLFKYWSRQDREVPGGGPYLLLGIDDGAGHWVFSTDPVQRLEIRSLAQRLQEAEAALDPARAQGDPWFEGAPFDHTLIAAPRAGTRLSDRQVLRIARRWARARDAGGLRVPRIKAALALLVLTALVVVGLTFPLNWWSTDSTDRGMTRRTIPVQVTEARQGKDYALLIATDEYDHWPDLGNPCFDARALQQELTTHYGFETRLVENPTRNQLIDLLSQYAASKDYENKDDQLFVFIAGHGDFDEPTRRGYLVARDSKRRDEDPLRNSYLSHADLGDFVAKIHCRHVFLVVDACFAGTIDFNIATERFRGSGASPERGMDRISKDEFIRRRMTSATRLCLTSGTDVPVPDGATGEHSPFIRHLLSTLREGGKDGIVTVADLYRNVDDLHAQSHLWPLPGNEGDSDFLFIRP